MCVFKSIAPGLFNYVEIYIQVNTLRFSTAKQM